MACTAAAPQQDSGTYGRFPHHPSPDCGASVVHQPFPVTRPAPIVAWPRRPPSIAPGQPCCPHRQCDDTFAVALRQATSVLAVNAATESREGMVVIHATKRLLDGVPTPPSDIDQPTGDRSEAGTPPCCSGSPRSRRWSTAHLPTAADAPRAGKPRRAPPTVPRRDRDTPRCPPHHAPAPFVPGPQPSRPRCHERARTPRRLPPHAGEIDLVTLAVDLARTRIGPVYTTHVSLDRALTALTRSS